MVWDRESKGPAMFNGHPAGGLTEAQAAEIKSQPVRTTIRVGGELTKNALDSRGKRAASAARHQWRINLSSRHGAKTQDGQYPHSGSQDRLPVPDH
jgi:hypothetical protein